MLFPLKSDIFMPLVTAAKTKRKIQLKYNLSLLKNISRVLSLCGKVLVEGGVQRWLQRSYRYGEADRSFPYVQQSQHQPL